MPMQVLDTLQMLIADRYLDLDVPGHAPLVKDVSELEMDVQDHIKAEIRSTLEALDPVDQAIVRFGTFPTCPNVIFTPA